jgi:signal peptidase I
MTAGRILLGFIALFLGALAIVYVVNPYDVPTRDPRARLTGFVPYRIPSESMLATLPPDAIVFVDTRASARRELLPGDIVVFSSPVDPPFQWIARAIAFGGETVEIRDGALFVNDEPVPEDHFVLASNARLDRSRTLSRRTVPEGHVFVMGDNRDNSYDSRFWGGVPTASIIGVLR